MTSWTAPAWACARWPESWDARSGSPSSLVIVFAALLLLLGLQFLSQSLNQGILVLPKLFIAAVLVLAGVVLAGFARERVGASQLRSSTSRFRSAGWPRSRF